MVQDFVHQQTGRVWSSGVLGVARTAGGAKPIGERLRKLNLHEMRVQKVISRVLHRLP